MVDSRSLATRIVAIAITLIGIALVAGAVALMGTGTPGAVLGGLFLIGVGLVVLLAAFFFLLVPSRVDRLHDLNVEYVEEEERARAIDEAEAEERDEG